MSDTYKLKNELPEFAFTNEQNHIKKNNAYYHSYDNNVKFYWNNQQRCQKVINQKFFEEKQ